jgi:hypothetical protein
VVAADIARSSPFKLIHSLRFAVCSLYQHNIGEQSRSRIRVQPWKLGSVVIAQGAAYSRNGLDRQGYESGIPQRGR